MTVFLGLAASIAASSSNLFLSAKYCAAMSASLPRPVSNFFCTGALPSPWELRMPLTRAITAASWSVDSPAGAPASLCARAMSDTAASDEGVADPGRGL